jgi:hypothetical protein
MEGLSSRKATAIQTMTLATDEFIRRFLMQSATTACWPTAPAPTTSRKPRKLLNVPAPQKQSSDTKAGRTDEPPTDWQSRPCYGGRMIIIGRFERGACPALPPEPGGDQDRHLMIESAQSSSRNVGHCCRCCAAEHASARGNTMRTLQMSPRYPFLHSQTHQRNASPAASHQNNSYRLSLAFPSTRHRSSNPHS